MPSSFESSRSPYDTRLDAACAAFLTVPATAFAASPAALTVLVAAPLASLPAFLASFFFRVAAPFLAAALRSALVCIAIRSFLSLVLLCPGGLAQLFRDLLAAGRQGRQVMG
jgi:hypothetical protein